MASDALVVTGGGVGNLIQATPLIAAASHFHNNPVDVWLAGDAPWMADLLQGHEYVRRISSDREQAMGPVEKYVSVYYTFLRKGSTAQKVPAAHYYAGWHPRYPRHESECAMSCIRGAGYQGVTPPTFCAHDPWPYEKPPGVLIGISTGSKATEKWPLKRYPASKYAEVVTEIHKEIPAARFLLFGVPSDDYIAHPLVEDLRGVGTLREQIGLIKECTAFISNDTGLMHVSAAKRVQTFGVFGPTNLWKNLPKENTIAIRLEEGRLDCMPCQKMSGGHSLGKRGDGSLCARECFQLLEPRSVAEPVITYLRGVVDEIYDSSNSL